MKYVVVLLAVVGCTPRGPIELVYPIAPEEKRDIMVRAEVDSDLMEKVEYSLGIINKEVFDDPSCPHLQMAGAGEPVDIYLYDDEVVGPYSCDRIWAAVSKDHSYAKVNFCGLRMEWWGWQHALDPDIYMVTHNIAKVMGLPLSVSRGRAASYTANDQRLRSWDEKRGSVMFRFLDAEVTALRKQYCNI